MNKTLVQNLAIYGVAAGIIWYLARDVPVVQLIHNLKMARLWIFLPACLGSFLIWFVGETFLFSRLFSYFHTKTSFREMLPANAAQYFLQLVNVIMAGTALVLFMHRRKGVPWLSGGCTMIFQTFIDFQILALMTLLGAAFEPRSIIRQGWYYAALALALMWLFAWFWKRGRPQWRPARWFYDRPSMMSFRQAGAAEYAKLILIRAPIFVGQGLMLFYQMVGFGIRAPLPNVMAYTPVVLVLGGLPITPVGLGPLQAVLVAGFSAFAGKANLLAMALAISFMNIVFRIPLGLGSAGTFAREVVESDNDVALAAAHNSELPRSREVAG